MKTPHSTPRLDLDSREDPAANLLPRLRCVVENLQAGILVETEAREIECVNQAFLDLFHIPLTAEELVGLDCRQAAQGLDGLLADPVAFGARIDELLAARELVSEEEIELTDGRTLVRDYIPLAEGDRSLGNLWVYRDITDRVRATQAKSQFLAAISHELRTPLTSIMAAAEMLSQRRLDDDGAELLVALRRNAESLLSQIDDLLDLPLLEAEPGEAETVGFEWRPLIATVEARHEPTATLAGLTLTTFVDPRLAGVWLGAENDLSRVLSNLVDNAVKFTDRGGVEISVALTEEPDRRGREVVELRVEDSGIGIAADDLPQIFEPLDQLTPEPSRRRRGIGLGLHVTRLLVARLEGAIEVDSETGRGTSVRVRVPCHRGSWAGHKGEAPSLVGTKLLLVEDNRDGRLLCQRILEQGGAHVTCTGSGREALALLQRKTFDGVLMDVELPGLDGIETTRRLRHRESQEGLPATPVIALTAHAVDGYRERCLAAGMNTYLTKPFRRLGLLRAVSESLPGGRLDRAPIRVRIDPDIADLVPAFLNARRRQLTAMRADLEANRLPAVADAAHQIKGVGASYGFAGLSRLAARLEIACSLGDRREAIGLVERMLADLMRTQVQSDDGS
ncbi:MAG: response regulator [Acidobacteriota bacterium]